MNKFTHSDLDMFFTTFNRMDDTHAIIVACLREVNARLGMIGHPDTYKDMSQYFCLAIGDGDGDDPHRTMAVTLSAMMKSICRENNILNGPFREYDNYPGGDYRWYSAGPFHVLAEPLYLETTGSRAIRGILPLFGAPKRHS